MIANPSVSIGEHDILLGKSKICHGHYGNKQFRQVIQEFRQDYQEARFRKDKGRTTQRVLKILTANGGRFLKYDRKQQAWCEVDEADQYKKVSHALQVARGSSSSYTNINHNHNTLAEARLLAVESRKTQQQGEEHIRRSDPSPLLTLPCAAKQCVTKLHTTSAENYLIKTTCGGELSPTHGSNGLQAVHSDDYETVLRFLGDLLY